MKFAVCACDLEGGRRAAARLASQRVTMIEAGARFFLEHDEAAARAVGDAFRAEGVAINSIHAPFRVPNDLAAEDEAQRLATVDLIGSLLPKAAAAGTPIVVVHPGHCYPEKQHAAALRRAENSLCVLARRAEETGVTLALENLPPTYLGSSAEDLNAVREAVGSKALKFCFDTGHAHMTGRFAENLRAMLPHIAHFHVHDNNGARDQHLTPPFGTIDWEEFTRIVRTRPDAPPLTLECAPWLDDMPPEGRGAESDYVALLELEEILFGHFEQRIAYEEAQRRVDPNWKMPAIVPHRADIQQ